MTDKTVSDVCKMIENAFSNSQHPGDDNLGRWSDIRVEKFKGKTWTSLSPDLIAERQHDLSDFSIDAFSYFLPAFMIALLQYPDEFVNLDGNLFYYLSPPSVNEDQYRKIWFNRMMKNFTKEQVTAIVAFGELYKRMIPSDEVPNELESSVEFWHKQ